MANKIISLIMLIILSPVFLVLGSVLLISQGRPIIFNQKRIGKDGVIFTMYKFRTMKNTAPDNIPTDLLVNPRHYNTFLGGFLRKFSIDEFPQLLNVFNGDMNFIGPRPSLVNQTDLISFRTNHGIIKSVPGVTGWAQVNGRDSNTNDEKAKMELFYKKNKSFLLDVKIMFLTIKNIIRPGGIYPDNK
jgi:O-antigen biosynthesis protein WbqP